MKRYLVLENGSRFEGEAFGADGEVTAEIVFTTAMTGYIETLTDPSYTGQAVVQTFPLIGNYGVINEDFESAGVGASAYIVREYCASPSNFRCEETLDAFLKSQGIPGLCGIDTRALTRLLREHGTMNGAVTADPDSVDTDALARFRVERPVARVSTREIKTYNEGGGHRVVLMDFGAKANILRCLVARGCEVTVVPHDTPARDIIALSPDGIMLSNGPGDPTDNPEAVAAIRELISERIPTMGICLGHQLLALAGGFKTHKLKYGHRGANQPVRQSDGRVYITSQNHGYAVTAESVDTKIARELFTNVNDGTNEGLEYVDAPAFSVQFHPEACGGPHDTGFLFDRFISMMEV